MEIERVAVIGAGTMGCGIAQVCARAGLLIRLADVSPELLERALAAIGRDFNRLVSRGVMDAGARADALARIEPRPDAGQAAADADIVIEAVPERRKLKKQIFRTLARRAAPGSVIASNTSSISITELGSQTSCPDRVIGMHFMNPVPALRLVEVIRGLTTSDDTVEIVTQLARRLGKTPVEVLDSPGFVSNRVLMPMINEAVFALMEGVAGADAIDTVMRLGMNHPMGPLELADLIGLDSCLSILEVLHQDLCDDRYRPCPLLRKYVAAGWLGRKTGRGFHVYADA